MTIIQHFDEQQQIVFVAWEGIVTAEQWFEYARKLVSHPAWNSTARIVGDLLLVTDTSSIGHKEISQAVEILSTNRSSLIGKKLAVLAHDQFGKARHFGELLNRFGTSAVVFNNLDTACLFLGTDLLYVYQTLDMLRQQVQLK